MNPYAAANSAKMERARKPLVKELNKEEQVKALYREQPHHHDSDEEQEHEPFSEEEEEQILLFAKMRGIMDFSLKTGVRYEFHINAQSGMVDLIDLESGQVVLQLQPEELLQLSQKIQRYAGMLTDRNG
jgi:uncharacterized FlaG/YvyC family protein